MSEGLPQSKAHNRPKEEKLNPLPFKIGGTVIAITAIAGAVGTAVDLVQQEQSKYFSNQGPGSARLGSSFQLGSYVRNVDGSLQSPQLFIDYSGQLRDGTFSVDFLGLPSNAGYGLGPPLNRDEDPRCVTNKPNGGNIRLCAVPKFDTDNKLTGYGVESENPIMARGINWQEGTVFQFAGSYKGKSGQLFPVVGQRQEPYLSYTPPLNAGLVPAYVGAVLALGAGTVALIHSAKRNKSAAQRVAEAEQKVASANRQLSIAQNDVRIERDFANRQAQEAAIARGEATDAKRNAVARDGQNSNW